MATEHSPDRGPAISVVIPVFNRARFLNPCVESVATQSFDDLEIILVDNNSDDGSWDICKSWSNRDARVRTYRQIENIGPVRNWKTGIRKSRGRYLKLLFSDDLVLPGYFESLIDFLEDPDVGFAFSEAAIGVAPDRCSDRPPWKSHSGVFSTASFIKERTLGSRVPVSPGAAIFRREDAERNLLEHVPPGIQEDWLGRGAGPDVLMYLLTASSYQHVGYCREPLAFFRAHADCFTLGPDSAAVERSYREAYCWYASQYQTAPLRERIVARAVILSGFRRATRFSEETPYQRYFKACHPIVLFLAFFLEGMRNLIERIGTAPLREISDDPPQDPDSR